MGKSTKTTINKNISKSERRISFNCSVCGKETKAPENTERYRVEKCTACFGKRKDIRVNQLNDLTGSEWALLSKSVEQYNGVRSAKQKVHGAAFPLSLVEAHIKIFTKEGQLVFDPFLGVGTTAQAAETLNRKSIGIELSKQFVRLAKKDIKNKSYHKIVCDDSRNMLKHVSPNSVDLILTSPPYATLLKSVKGSFGYKWRNHSDLNIVDNPAPYSTEKRDLGNLDYKTFISEIKTIFKGCYEVLKDNSYCVWIVKDYRDLKNGETLIPFHSDIIDAAKSAQFKLWDIRIYDQTRFRPLVVLGYPSRNYYLNIGHSYILIFKKDSKKAKQL